MAAPRANWKGYLRVSLVSCPVRLYPASSEAEKIRFHQLAPETKSRIKLQPIDPTTGKKVERGELLKGYPVDKDRYVIISDEDLEKITIESTRVIDVVGFVEMGAIDEIYADSPYYLVPDGKMAQDAFRVIREAMRLEDKAGIARLVLSTRERAVVLTPRDKGILIRTLRSSQEVRQAAPYFEDIEEGAPNEEMIELARTIVRRKTVEFSAEPLTDRYQEALRDLIEKKLRGEKVTAAKPRESGEVIDLMEALKRSLSGSKPPAESKRTRKTTAATKRAPKRKARSAK